MNEVETVRALYDAFRRKDEETLRRVLDPAVVWVQNEGFPGGGVHTGAEQVLSRAFVALRSAWEGWAADVHEWLCDGSTVMALGEYRGVHRITRRAMVAAFAHVYDVRDGRVVRFRQFTDTAVIAEAGRG